MTRFIIRDEQSGKFVLQPIFKETSELIDKIIEKALLQMAPQNLKIISPTNARTFLAYKVDRSGIKNDREKLAWEEINECIMKNGAITTVQRDEYPLLDRSSSRLTSSSESHVDN